MLFTTMKHMKKIISLLLLSFLAVVSLNAQTNYSRAVGIKAGGGFSFTYKQFVTENNNLEAQATLWNKGFRVSGLYEFNFYRFEQAPGLALFAGPGVHIGFWKDEFQKDYNSKAEFGIDGIIGLDYKFSNVPVNISLDWQPAVTLVGSAGFSPSFGGIGIRYTF